MSEPRGSATRQLDEIMKTQALVARRRRRWWLAPAVVLTAFFCGVVLARAMKPKPLLSAAQVEAPRVPKFEASASQLLYASDKNTEEAWKAVAEYFPPRASTQDQLNALRAQKGLADLYLREGRFSEAISLYEELTHLDPAEVQLRMQGHAGLLQVYYLTAQDDLASEQWIRLSDYTDTLDRETQRAVEQIHRKLAAEPREKEL
jgi:tetratricopeptide (TPR) repeat protein